MAYKPVFRVIKVLSVVLALALEAGLLNLWRRRQATRPANQTSAVPRDIDASESEPLMPEMQTGEMNPLSKAEVYLAFGRKRDAKTEIDLAVKNGTITHEDALLFSTQHEIQVAPTGAAQI